EVSDNAIGLDLDRVTADNFDNPSCSRHHWVGSWAYAYTAMAVVTKIATTNFGCMVGSSGRCDDAA
ncbi:MAG: hypothetical protein WBX78_13300, partial [Pseudolabrys sp.]